MELGEWDDTNILDYERKMIAAMPETWRDAPNMALYVSSMKYIMASYALKKKLEGQNTDLRCPTSLRLMAMRTSG
jgi:hypothetical protein